jgi:cell division protein FtsN
MSSPLEKFVQENREKFDAETPDPRVWEKINERLKPDSEKATPVRSLPFKRWMAAAAAVVLVGLASVLYYSVHQNKPREVAGTHPAHLDTSNLLPVINTPVDTSKQIAQKDPGVPQKLNPDNPEPVNPSNEPQTGENKEMFYYAKLIELKHEELKTLEKDEPLLYRQFSGDVQKLDSVYHSLKTQLPNNSNREQVIEAMISNLQLQIGLLNKQLDIIKKIKHSKKSAYEKAYKSV